MDTGTRFDHYELLSPLGRGGMGEVWKARDTKLGRLVAIKFVRTSGATDARAMERLQVEARAASALNHPNICTIYDFREHEGRPLIVMEFMNGQTLRGRLNSKPLKTQEALDIGIQVADALAAAHSHGIIHRDIKPENIFLTGEGLVKVLDFGLAKLLPQAYSLESTTLPAVDSLTSLGGAVGTVAYMSPEQASGEELDGRTDLFSLGVVLYTCATGHPPFTGKTAAVVLSSILNRAPVAPILLNPEIPPRFQEVIYNCLEKDRELRCQSASDLRVELKRVKRDLEFAHLANRNIPAENESGTQPASGRAAATIPVTQSGPAPATRTKRRAAPTAIGLALLAVIAAAAYLTLWQPSAPPPAEPNANAEAEIQSRLDQASGSLQDGQYRAAATYAEEVLQQAPDNATATAILEEAQAQLATFDQAVAEARQWLSAGNSTKAEQALEAARRIDPASPEIASLSSQLVGQLNAEARAARALAQRSRDSAQPPAPEPPATPAVESRPLPDERQPTAVAAGPPQTETPSAATVLASPAPSPPPPPPSQPPPESPVSRAPLTPPEPSPPQPTPQAPAPEQIAAQAGTAAAGPSRAEQDEAAIRAVIESYRRAIETRNLDLFRQIKPNLSAAEAQSIAKGFQDVSSQKVDFAILSIERSGDRASVKLERHDTIEAPGVQRSTNTRQTIELVRTGGRWVIDTIGE